MNAWDVGGTMRGCAGAAKSAARALTHVTRFAVAARYFRASSERRYPRALANLRSAWGNLGYTADLAYLSAVLRHAGSRPSHILECGSGLTTLLLALAGYQSVWSLEHAEEWCHYVRRRLWVAGTAAHVLIAPLVSYGAFEWYAVPVGLPRRFDLVVCDGPPGATPGGRYGLLPLLHNRLPRGAVILLHDAQRIEEQGVLERWRKEAGWTYTIEPGAPAYAIVTVT